MKRVTEWKPGAVALVTLRQPGFNSARGGGPFLMLRDVSGVKEVWRLASTGIVHEDGEVEVVQPLAVIDPTRLTWDGRIPTAREFTDWAESLPAGEFATGVLIVADALREFANPTPPKPEEPTGLGAVVEDLDGSLLTKAKKHAGHDWVSTGGSWFKWDDIDVAQILSEGVPA